MPALARTSMGGFLCEATRASGTQARERQVLGEISGGGEATSSSVLRSSRKRNGVAGTAPGRGRRLPYAAVSVMLVMSSGSFEELQTSLPRVLGLSRSVSALEA